MISRTHANGFYFCKKWILRTEIILNQGDNITQDVRTYGNGAMSSLQQFDFLGSKESPTIPITRKEFMVSMERQS